MLPRLSGVLLIGLSLVVPLAADDLPGHALPLFDAYLAEEAKSVTAYRADIRIGDDPKDLEGGRRSGESAYLGAFTYRPITYAELSRSERALLVHDPQFHAFLVSEAQSFATRADGRPASSSPARFHFTIPPDEMLRTRPFVIVLPP